MKLGALSRDVFWSLAAHPARSSALVLSLAAGLTAVVFVFSVIAGFGREIDRLAFGAYASSLVVRENPFVPDRQGPPRVLEGDVLRHELGVITGVAAWRAGRGETYRDGERIAFDLFGVVGDFEVELDAPLALGRFPTPEELAAGARVCLVAGSLAESLGPTVLGSRLVISGVNCQVIGVLGPPRSRPAARYADAVLTPLGAAERYFDQRPEQAPGTVDRLTLMARPGTDMLNAQVEADLTLRRLRGVPLSRPSPFTYGDPSASLRQQIEQRDMLSRLLLLVASLSLISSLVAYGAISAAGLAARRREFALRLAVGATGADIRAQVLAETVITGMIASMGGVALGLALAAVTSALWAWPFVFSGGVAAVGVVMGLLVGASVGVILARRMSSVSPAVAART